MIWKKIYYAFGEAQFGNGRGINPDKKGINIVLVLGDCSMPAKIVIIIIPRKVASSKFCEGSRSRQEEEVQEAIRIFAVFLLLRNCVELKSWFAPERHVNALGEALPRKKIIYWRIFLTEESKN